MTNSGPPSTKFTERSFRIDLCSHRNLPLVYDATYPSPAQADIERAKTLAFVAIVLYGIFGTIITLFGVLAPFLLFFGIVPLLFLAIAYATVYKPLTEGRPMDAQTPALVLGIISLFIGGLISGILLLIAYAKASSAARFLRGFPGPPPPRETTIESAPTKSPTATVARESPRTEGQAIRYCPSCGSRVEPGYRFCNNCGQRLPRPNSGESQ